VSFSEPKQAVAGLIIIYVEAKKNGAGYWGAQTSKWQPTKRRDETGAGAPAFCHFQRAQGILEAAENQAARNRCNYRRGKIAGENAAERPFKRRGFGAPAIVRGSDRDGPDASASGAGARLHHLR
jgi:hypothetical protein